MDKDALDVLFQPDEWWWWLAMPIYLVFLPITLPATIIWLIVDAL